MSKMKVIIFGLGKYWDIISPWISDRIEIVAYMDNRCESYQGETVIRPDKWNQIKFDKVLLCVKDEKALTLMTEQLVSLGVSTEKIGHIDDYQNYYSGKKSRHFNEQITCNGDKKKVYAIHPMIGGLSDLKSYLKIDSLDVSKGLIWDEDQPDYIVISENIYTRKECYELFLKYLFRCPQAIYIYSGGESIAPDMNIFDYAIVYDYQMHYQDRISRIPPGVFHSYAVSDYENTCTCKKEAENLIKERKFCNFIYSNPLAHPMRDRLFYKLSEYRKVDSWGYHLNNTNPSFWQETEDVWVSNIKKKSEYKFSIAAENACYSGYTSEKLLTSFQSHSVPIYWGNPNVAEEYNEEAFINCNAYTSLDDVLKIVIEIDKDDDRWCEMVSKPWQTRKQIEQMRNNMQQYLNFMENIFTQPLDKARRRGSGFYPLVYMKFFLQNGF